MHTAIVLFKRNAEAMRETGNALTGGTANLVATGCFEGWILVFMVQILSGI
ncbi:hypothetical protein [Niastella vici]|uniref:hypothetical protein n=1 Tax=Niastella vici TaxID=1703345 RepID=UPI001C1F2716|nr:hypothetical protein [Niastella vici]